MKQKFNTISVLLPFIYLDISLWKIILNIQYIKKSCLKIGALYLHSFLFWDVSKSYG